MYDPPLGQDLTCNWGGGWRGEGVGIRIMMLGQSGISGISESF